MCCCLFSHGSASLSVQEQYRSPFTEFDSYLTKHFSLGNTKKLKETFRKAQAVRSVPVLPAVQLKARYSSPFPPARFPRPAVPGQHPHPKGLDSFLCCTTPHAQETKHKQQNPSKTKKPKHSLLSVPDRNQYFLKTCKHAKLILSETTTLGENRQTNISNQRCSTFTGKFCCLLGVSVCLGVFFLVVFWAFFKITPQIFKAIHPP